MIVTLFRRNTPGAFSIENVTEGIRTNLPQDVDAVVFVPSVTNEGFFNNLNAGFQTIQHQGEINHITGHVHYMAFFLDPKRTIITMHDCERLMSQDWGWFRKLIYKWIYFKWPARYCRFITTISEESKKNLIEYGEVPEEKIRVIPDGTEMRLRPLRLTEAEKKELLQNPSGKKAVLHIAQLHPHKNLRRLVEALKGLNVKFVRVGALDDQHREMLERNKIDYVQFMNIDMDLLGRIYCAVDCLAFPSLIEGFGLPVVEAQACSCPVVTSNISSLPEVADDAAILVNPFSVESIRGAILRVLYEERLRDDLVQKGIRNVRRFSWPNIACQYYKLYQEIEGCLKKDRAVCAG